ncbi:MAG: DUF4266 domain-containing protein [bacterium]|nr:DUF4266 domain-containing protein [bacterium]
MKSNNKLRKTWIHNQPSYPKLLYFLFIFLSITILGCTAVAPWEKGNLSKSHMRINPDPLESRFHRHIEDSREGSSGGYGIGGGGCGCG